MKKERDITRTISKIRRAMPELDYPISSALKYCAPESMWYQLTDFINQNVKADSNNRRSVAVYAALMGVNRFKMRKMLIERGL